MTREFIIDMQVSGKYDDALYELETVEEALAEWSLMYPDEYTESNEELKEDYEEPLVVINDLEELHADVETEIIKEQNNAINAR